MKNKKINKKKIAIQISKSILTILGLSAILATAIVAPNALQIFKLFEDKDKNFKKIKYNTFRNTINRMNKQKLIKITKTNNQIKLMITKNGLNKYDKIQLENIKIKKPKIWDKKWRFVVFDIPNTKRLARAALRRKISELGFKKYQKSVWIIPYKCRNAINMIKKVYKIEKHVNYIIAENIDNNIIYKKYFNLYK